MEVSTATPTTESDSMVGPDASGPTLEPAEECESVVEPAESESTDKSEDGPVNPHLEEIMKCPANDWQLEKKDPVPFKSLDETPFTIVDSKDLLEEMMTKLRTVNEIGLAIKRFTYRSFHGISSLIQIATRSEVFLVDAIALKEEVKVLSEILTSPNVLKVVHSWEEAFVDNLQKDLDIYMVNLFSLPVAWRTINQTNKNKALIGTSPSLGGLLKEHCDVDFYSFFKEYRSSGESRDWDKRPLTDGKIKCTRLEVQYLLHIYDIYRNLLIDMDLLKQVYQVCNKVCKSVWHPGKAALHPKLYLSLYKRLGEGSRGQKKAKWPLSKLQMEVLKVLHDWRFTTAEKHNESRSYLLKDMAIYRIASTLPKDVEGIKKCISPDEVCPLLEENFDHLRELIVTTVDEMASDPDSSKKIPFFLPDEKKSVAGSKRKKSAAGAKKEVLDVRCHACGKGAHTPGQTCAKKTGYQKPFFNSGRALPSGHPQYPMYPHRPMMGPRMGPWMGPQMGARMDPQMGGRMAPRGMGPRGMAPYGMGMHQPRPYYGW